MMVDFVVLGAGTLMSAPGWAGSPYPARLAMADLAGGVSSIATGLFGRDHVVLVGPGFAGESWHDRVHDVVSGVGYGAMFVAPLVLARRCVMIRTGRL